MPKTERDYRVVLAHKDRWLVRRGDDELYCVLAGSLRYREEYPVVGDYVEIVENPYGDSLIRAILPRRTVFCRPDRGGHADGFVKTAIDAGDNAPNNIGVPGNDNHFTITKLLLTQADKMPVRPVPNIILIR